MGKKEIGWLKLIAFVLSWVVAIGAAIQVIVFINELVHLIINWFADDWQFLLLTIGCLLYLIIWLFLVYSFYKAKGIVK
jgi:hypothetical protein